MEAKAFSSLVCRTHAAPLTRRLLGNSVSTYSKIFCEKHSVRQINLPTLSILGLEAFPADISKLPRRAPTRADEQLKEGQFQGADVIEYLLWHLKKVDMKFALLFKLKREELRQVLDGDTAILEAWLKNAAESANLKDGNYCLIPNTELSRIVEKLRQTISVGVHVDQMESIANEKLQNGCLEENPLNTFAAEQPIKYFSGRRPSSCDKSTQYEHFHGLSEGSNASCQLLLGKKQPLANKLIQCEDTETALKNSEHKVLSQEVQTFRGATQCQVFQSTVDSLVSLNSNILLAENDVIQDNGNATAALPDDSLVLIRKKIIEKEFGLGTGEVIMYKEPTFDDILTHKKRNGSLEWLAEETEPEFENSFDSPNDDEDCEDIARIFAIEQHALRLDDYSQQYLETNCACELDRQLTVIDRDVQMPFVNYSHYFGQDNAISNSVDQTNMDDCCPQMKTSVHFLANRPTKIPIPIVHKQHFQRLLENPLISKIKFDSSKYKFFDKQSINNAKFQLQHTEGYDTLADALYGCQKLPSKESVEFFDQNYPTAYENLDDILTATPKLQNRPAKKVPISYMKLGAPKKHIRFSENLVEIDERRQQKSGKLEIISAEKLLSLSNMLPTKPTLSNSKSKINKSYDEKQRHLVKLIACGVEQEMLSSIKESQLVGN